MKNSLIYVGVLFTLVSIVYVSLDNEVEYENYSALKDEIVLQTKSDITSEIEYTKPEIKERVETDHTPKPKPVEKKKIIRDKRIKHQSVDASGRYGIQLIDETEKQLESIEKVSVEGKINGSRFTFKIPVELINSEPLLKITDRETKETVTLDLPFVADLSSGSAAPAINVEFANPQNYTLKEVSKAFP